MPVLSVDACWGLAISKGIEEAHGSRIWTRATGWGPGARFTVTLLAVQEADTLLTERFPVGAKRRGRQRRSRYFLRLSKDLGTFPRVS